MTNLYNFCANVLSSFEGSISDPKPLGARMTTLSRANSKIILKTVKLTSLLILAACLQVSAASNAQKLSISIKNGTLQKLFSEIEQQTGFSVFYNVGDLKYAKPVTIEAKDVTVEEILKLGLKNQALTYFIQEHTIFIKKEVVKAVSDVQGAGVGEGPPGVSVVVSSEIGLPLAGATVYIEKLKRAGLTDAEGKFLLKNVSDGVYEVEISFVGYQNSKETITVVNHAALVTVKMSQSMDKLDETVVKGYYNTSERLNTGDVTTVKGEDIEKQPVSDPILALEGRVPGLYIQQTSGVPGSYSTIMIRGQNSIANGNNPLYIVDGVPYSSLSPTSVELNGGALGLGSLIAGNGQGLSPFNDLNPADIERIEVLKDADATAIYGSRGANGVILITTKKGKIGSTRFNLNTFSGFAKATRFMQFMNTGQYLEMRNEAFANDGLTPGPNDYDLNGGWDTTRYTDWQKVLIGNTAKFSNVEASISGGNQNTQFRISTGYSKQSTVYPGNFSDQKAMVNFNMTHSSLDQRLHMQITASYVYQFSDLPVADLTSYFEIAPDSPPLYNADGSFNWQIVNGAASWYNPLPSFEIPTVNAKVDNLVSNFQISYAILPGLQIKSNFGYSHLENNQTNQIPASASPPPYNNLPANRQNRFGTNNISTWIIEPQLFYEREISRGKLNILIGTTFQQNFQNAVAYSTSGYASDALISDPVAASTENLIGFNNTLYHYDAAFGRVNYDWQSKYLINLTGRRDGSSRFGPGKQFGNFGAVGLGWIFSKENGFQNVFPFLSFGKLRASYGSAGNDQILDYQYLSAYSPNSRTYQGITGLSPLRLANPYFAWELVKKLEGGLELGFLKDKILLTASYFRDRTGNQLVGYPLPSVTGFSTIQANLPADVQNSGGEFTLRTVNIKSKNFAWTSYLNLSVPRNKLIAYPNLAISPYSHSYVVGKSIFSQRLYHFAGVNDTTGVYQFVTSKGLSDAPSFPQDLEVTKPITQHWYGGFENSISYKGFELSFLVQVVSQTGFNYFSAAGGYYAGSFNYNYPKAILNRWQKPGDNAHYGLYSTEGNADPNGDLPGSDFGLGNNSFLRLKNLAFSYSFSKGYLKKIHLQNARIYIQCQNLFTITHNYLGFDPENSSGALPPLRMITGGLEIGL
jgi:TonB-linked SusC/RagA family outer membrane protein